MKRAKFMLAAIAVMAIAGGVYASKAMNKNAIVYTHNPLDLPTVCTVPLTGITTTINDFPTTLFATTTKTLPCVTSVFFTID